MKRLIASDIHGSAAYCRKLLQLYHQEGCKELILLGDIAYSGSYDEEYDFDPRAVIRLLDLHHASITCVSSGFSLLGALELMVETKKKKKKRNRQICLLSSSKSSVVLKELSLEKQHQPHLSTH